MNQRDQAFGVSAEKQMIRSLRATVVNQQQVIQSLTERVERLERTLAAGVPTVVTRWEQYRQRMRDQESAARRRERGEDDEE